MGGGGGLQGKLQWGKVSEVSLKEQTKSSLNIYFLLRYNYLDSTWNVSDKDHLDTTQVYCCTQCSVDDPLDIAKNLKWFVFDDTTRKHTEQKVTISNTLRICFVFFLVELK